MNEKDTQMVERVAKAIDPEAFGPCPAHWAAIKPKGLDPKTLDEDWKSRTDWRRKKARSVARAAISAMPDTAAQSDTVTPHYCYDPDSWEYTMQWSQREELVEDWNCGQAHKVATLVQGPDKWVAHIPIDTTGDGNADDLETHWFDSEESALRAIAGELA